MLRLSFLLLLSAAAWDVTPSMAQLRGTIHVGVTGSTFRGGALQDASPIYRLTGGAGVRYIYPSGLELESGLDYAVKGASLKGTFEDIPITGTSEITYLSVPFLIGYRWDAIGRMRPRLVAGPSLGYKTDARISYRAVGSDLEQSTTDDGIGQRDLGWIVGVDVDMPLGGEVLFSGIRLTLGQSNARTVKPDVLNTTVAWVAGIVF